jgi:cupin fold WbuC family metalloprotein
VEHRVKPAPLRLLNQSLFDQVAQQASASQRLRKNYNLHDEQEPVQRFLNVLQPGTYVRPHRHIRPAGSNGFECFVVLQGSIGFLVLDETGQVLQQECLSAQGPNYGIEVGQGQFHTLVALAANTVVFELKEGPYSPTADKDFLSCFPLEGSLEARQQVQFWEQQFSNETTTHANASSSKLAQHLPTLDQLT